MEQLRREGFVVADSLQWTTGAGKLVLLGDVECQGPIKISVEKSLDILEGDGVNAMVQTVNYSYHAQLMGVGPIVRNEGPHPTHNQDHHVHRYDVLAGDRDGQVEFICNTNDVPTLGEFIGQVRDWYYANADSFTT